METQGQRQQRAWTSTSKMRAVVEIGIALAASTVIALMVVGGGVAAERMATDPPPIIDPLANDDPWLPEHEAT